MREVPRIVREVSRNMREVSRMGLARPLSVSAFLVKRRCLKVMHLNCNRESNVSGT
jgi:hypothetical protein